MLKLSMFLVSALIISILKYIDTRYDNYI